MQFIKKIITNRPLFLSLVLVIFLIPQFTHGAVSIDFSDESQFVVDYYPSYPTWDKVFLSSLLWLGFVLLVFFILNTSYDILFRRKTIGLRSLIVESMMRTLFIGFFLLILSGIWAWYIYRHPIPSYL